MSLIKVKGSSLFRALSAISELVLQIYQPLLGSNNTKCWCRCKHP